MSGSTIACPNCGAPVQIQSPAAVLAVCVYCQTASYWDEQGIRAAGVQSRPIDGFTRLYLGATGTLGNDGAPGSERFVVLGRVRQRYAGGIWDEWYIQMSSGQVHWLTEDDHELAIQQRYEGATPNRLRDLRPGERFDVGGVVFEVDEVGETVCEGIAGELPKHISTGERYPFLDASSIDGKRVLGAEFDADPPTLFIGEWLAHEAIRLDDEGEAW